MVQKQQLYTHYHLQTSAAVFWNHFKAEPGEEFALDLPRYYWEQELVKGKTAELYVTDPAKFNAGFRFYDCDSLPIKLSIEALRAHS